MEKQHKKVNEFSLHLYHFSTHFLGQSHYVYLLLEMVNFSSTPVMLKKCQVNKKHINAKINKNEMRDRKLISFSKLILIHKKSMCGLKWKTFRSDNDGFHSDKFNEFRIDFVLFIGMILIVE